MTSTEQKKTGSKQKTSLQLFIIGGLLGSLIDTFYRSMTEQQFVFQGFFSNLFGGKVILPFLPVYGFGIVLIYLLQPFALRQRLPTRLLIFGGSLTLLEFFAGVFVSLTLKNRLWDYSNGFLNIYGHVDLLHALYWTVLGTVGSYFFIKYPPEKWFPLQHAEFHRYSNRWRKTLRRWNFGVIKG